MRIKTTAAIVLIVLAGAIAFSVIGQEEPLPVVTPKANLGQIPLAEPTVVLAVEPIRAAEEPTLLEAARGNDYVSFDALYTAARNRGEDVSQFATLHELWTYSVTDPIGAFYGRDLYARLAAAFPGYARYIEEHAIIDSRGNVFYPSSETRAFLIDRIIEGRTPRVRVVQASPPVSEPVAEPTPVAVAPRVVIRPEPVRKHPVTVETVPEPAQAAPEVQTTPTPVVATTPVVQTAPVVQTTPVATPAAKPAVPAAPTPPAREPIAPRGVLLLVIGLIGIGLLALILRAPREEPVRIVRPGNVEPLHKPPVTPNVDKRAS